MMMRLLAIVLCLLAVVSPGVENGGGLIDFNFDQVDIPAFARLVGELTGRRFVVADDIQRKITVISPRVTPDEVYPLFVRIIESAGCSIVSDGDVFRIVALPQNESVGAPVYGHNEATPQEGVITKIIRLEHISATSMQQTLAARAGGKSVSISAIEETNHLIVTDTAGSVRRIEKIIAEIDRPGMTRVTEVVTLQHASAEDLARQLNAALAESESRGSRLKQRLPALKPEQSGARSAYVVPSVDSGRLILVGTSSQVTFLKDIIGKMDVDVPSGRGRLNAIFLKYLSAEEAAKSINALLEKSAVGGDGKSSRKIAIEASVSKNALLVDGSQGDFQVVSELVRQLDYPQEQIHIEVMIAEVSVDDNLSLGVDMAALDMPQTVGDSVVQGASLFGNPNNFMTSIQQGLFPNGITIGVASGTRYDASGNLVVSYPGAVNIDAVKTDSNLRIVSKTALEAQNNQEASVSIVDDIPILTSTIQGGTGASRDVIQNIDRIEVGIKLNLTPHVIQPGMVRMELNPRIEAVVEPQSSDGSQNLTPTIARREVSTTVTVADRRTIIIAGLTRHDTKNVVRKVPILGSIPLLGWLFRHSDDVDQKTDLLVLVTPRIVENAEAAEEVTEDWRNRTGLPGDEPE